MIKLIVLDVDGCMTDGNIIYTSDDKESKNLNVKDGLGISSWVKLGKQAAIITGRNSFIVEKRAKELGINYIYQGIKDKERQLSNLLEQINMTFNEVAIIGDDYNDLKMLRKARISFCPNDAAEGIKKTVDRVLTKKGGQGAVREMIDFLIVQENLESEFLKIWE